MIKQIIRVMNLSGKYRSKIRLSYLFSFFKTFFSYCPYILGMYMIKGLYEERLGKQDIILIWLALLAVFAGQVLFQYLCEKTQSRAGYGMFAELRIRLGDLLKKLPMGFYTDGNIGKISTILSVDMVYIESNCMSTIAEYVANIWSQVLVCLMMLCIHPILGITTIAIVIIYVLIGNVGMKKEQKEADNKQELNEDLAEHVLEYIEGTGVIRAYNMTENEDNALDDAFERMQNECIALEKKVTPQLRSVEFVNAAGVILLIGAASLLYGKGNIDMFSALLVCMFSFGAFRPVKDNYQQVTRFAVMNSSLNRIEDLFGQKPLNESAQMNIPDSSDGKIPEIEFKKVSFAYENENVLEDVSFCIKKNEMCALIGPSGGGKSTVANLLMRFWDVNEGAVCIRGTDVRNVPFENLMDNVSVVFQRVYLFKDSIYNNIKMGRPDATREEVLECAKRARCMEFISKLPYGIDTVVGEGGTSLSGGEAQRISIARCILKDSPIVILDEATASVDADNEAYIQEAIDELCKGKTLLVIAHRMNTINNADTVYRVEDKKLLSVC